VSHIPVLQKEVLRYLDPKPNENFIDCTIGGGGHTLAILEKTGPNGKILGIDADPKVIRNLELEIRNFKKRIILVHNNFTNLGEIIENTKFNCANGILFDLGMSSWHLEDSGRGFSFQKSEPLDMRYNAENPNYKLQIPNALTAEKIVNYWSHQEIEKILREYGEEKFSERIARMIIEARRVRPIETTLQLVEIIKRATPEFYQYKKLHFATKTFQALRIAVNDELNNLTKALPQALEVLKKNGRLVVISFHSLEDRIVKNFFRQHLSKNKLQILTRKPVVPGTEEIRINPRSRSAKLRAALIL